MPLIQDYNKLFEYTDNIKKVILNGNIVWPTAKPAAGPDYTEPFYSDNTTDQTESVTFYRSASDSPTFDVYYSLDKGSTWNFCGSTAESFTYRNTPHTKVWFCAETTRWTLEGGYSTIFIRDCKKVGGNIMSLLYGRDFNGAETSFPSGSNYNFYSLFTGNTTLVDASELLLPVTALTERCYQAMFYNCTSLTTAPALPATTLTTSCYQAMFYNCTSLTTAPALPATTLALQCYWSMFRGCTSLITATALPATTLVNSCYGHMFNGCTSLTTAPELPATTLANYCYQYMFSGCTSLTTAPALPATTLANSCYYYMFSRCTSLTTAPALPATTLAQSCYTRMFDGCVALIKAPDLLATTLVNSCYLYMFYKCTALNEIKCLATNPSSANYNVYTHSWLYGVSSTGTFTKAAGITWPTGANGIPSGWAVVEV